MSRGLPAGAEIRLIRAETHDLAPADIDAVRALLRAAFADDGEGFTGEDWDHATGGTHLIARRAETIVGHAAVVPRPIRIGGRAVRAGYVEAVATHPALQGGGIGTALMGAAAEVIGEQYDLGVLSTGSHAFYARLGWLPWEGRSYVQARDGRRRPTPDDDGSLMVLPTRRLPEPDPTADIECDWRSGDVW